MFCVLRVIATLVGWKCRAHFVSLLALRAWL